LKLSGLHPDFWYQFRHLASGKKFSVKGSEAMTAGLTVTCPEKPGVVIITYELMP
jgi:hypothetical protein